MSLEAGEILLRRIEPIITATVPTRVKTVGSEDHAELVQDCITSAAQMIDAAEAGGKPLIPQSIAFYAIQRTKCGRRAMSASRTDAMSSAAALDGNAHLESMDEAMQDSGDDGCFTLHDCLASPTDDTAQLAGRACDWSEFERHCDDREQAVLRAIAEGRKMNKVAKRFRISAPRICHIRQEIGARMYRLWGARVLQVATAEPAWRKGMRAAHERSQAKYERRQAKA